MAQMVKLDFQSLSTEITIRFFTEVDKMANIKSAKKRILVNQTKYERNKAVKSAVKTAIKKVEAAVAANDTKIFSRATSPQGRLAGPA